MSKRVKEKEPPPSSGDGAQQQQHALPAVNYRLVLAVLAGVALVASVCLFTSSGISKDTDDYSSLIPANSSLQELLGVRGALLFNSLDRDRDGQLSSEEFGPVIEKLTGEVGFNFNL